MVKKYINAIYISLMPITSSVPQILLRKTLSCEKSNGSTIRRAHYSSVP